MPITNVIEQPQANSINAAYRPIIISVYAQATGDVLNPPPVVYADIYFAGNYYKTYSKTQYVSSKKLTSTSYQYTYTFDIQDICQEFLKYKIETFGTAEIIDATNVIVNCFVRLRSSGYNTAGFLEQEGTAPIQKTSSSDAVEGDGYQSNTFAVVSATLQHTDNTDLATHLDSYKTGAWLPDVWPLTHRSIGNYKTCPGMSDFFPLLMTGSRTVKCLKIFYRMTGESGYRNDQYCFPTPCQLVNIRNVQAVANDNDTQTITFTFDELSSDVTSIAIAYRKVGGGSDDWVRITTAPTSPQFVAGIPLGKYEFVFTSNGDCIINNSDPVIAGLYANCPPTQFSSPPELPDGVVGQPYNYIVTLSGSPPTLIFPAVKPAWMTIKLNDRQIEFSGTPTTGYINTTNGVLIKIFSCSSEILTFNQNIHVQDLPTGNNRINVTVKPGGNWTPHNPYDNCYRWAGTIKITKISDNTIVANETYTTHDSGNVLQVEVVSANSLADGNYLIEWSLIVYQSCSAQSTTVRYRYQFGSQQRAATDSKVFTVSGGNIYYITLEAELS